MLTPALNIKQCVAKDFLIKKLTGTILTTRLRQNNYLRITQIFIVDRNKTQDTLGLRLCSWHYMSPCYDMLTSVDTGLNQSVLGIARSELLYTVAGDSIAATNYRIKNSGQIRTPAYSRWFKLNVQAHSMRRSGGVVSVCRKVDGVKKK